MAWGIMMTVVTMVGMFALVMHEVMAAEPQTQEVDGIESDAVSSAASVPPVAA